MISCTEFISFHLLALFTHNKAQAIPNKHHATKEASVEWAYHYNSSNITNEPSYLKHILVRTEECGQTKSLSTNIPHQFMNDNFLSELFNSTKRL